MKEKGALAREIGRIEREKKNVDNGEGKHVYPISVHDSEITTSLATLFRVGVFASNGSSYLPCPCQVSNLTM